MTAVEVLANIQDSDEDELDLDQTYPEDDLESVDDDSEVNVSSQSGSESDTSERWGRSSQLVDGSGDAGNFHVGWQNLFSEPNIDLQFDNSDNGFRNVPDSITAESGSIDFVSLFFDNEFWEHLCRMTNLRASQTLEQKPNSYYAKGFTPVSPAEMKAFIGLRLYMEYLIIKPSYRDHWLSEGNDFVTFTPGFRQVMTRDRFLAIWKFLHVVDEEDPSLDKTDKIYKVRPMLNDLLQKFRHYYKPNKHLSLDEGMIPTKNRLAIKQYIKDKPTKWGIKSFMLCEGDTGYILNAEIYTGKAEFVEQKLGAVGNTVIRLLTSSQLDHKAHVLVMDRYYNSVILADY